MAPSLEGRYESVPSTQEVATPPIPSSNGAKDTSSFKPVDPADVAKHGMAAYRAPSLFQPHRAREAIRDAHDGIIPPLIGFFIGLASPPIAKIVATFGFDAIWVDWEHSAMTCETMTQMVHDIQFISEGKTFAVVRVPNHDHATMSFALDAGASVMVPQVETVEQARHILASTKFGRKANGTRSAPPLRYLPGLSDGLIDPTSSLHINLNRQAAIIIQIESLQGIYNLDAILTECGDDIDSVWLGSLDARISMDLSGGGFLGPEEEWVEALAVYEATLAKHNKPASGMAFGPPEMKASLSRGKSFMFSSADVFALMSTLGELATMRAEYPAKDYSKVFTAR